MDHNRFEVLTLTRGELYGQVWAIPTIRLAKTYGLSDVALGKVCKKYRIPKPPPGYWAKVRHGRNIPRTPLPPIDGAELQQVRIFRRPDSPDRNNKEHFAEAVHEEAITVPGRLQSPHLLVEQTVKTLRGIAADETGLLRSRAKDCLDIAVSKGSLDRAMLLMDTMVKALEARGYSVSVATEGNKAVTVAKVLNESIQIQLWELVNRRQRELTQKEKKEQERWPCMYSRPRYEYSPSGHQALYIVGYLGEGFRRVWCDGKKQKIEHCLDSFLRGLLIAAEELKADRIRREQCQKEREEKERRHMEEERRRREEEAKVQKLKDLVACWDESRRIREFLGAVEEAAVQKSGRLAKTASFGDGYPGHISTQIRSILSC
jgi:hypothetical protein